MLGYVGSSQHQAILPQNGDRKLETAVPKGLWFRHDDTDVSKSVANSGPSALRTSNFVLRTYPFFVLSTYMKPPKSVFVCQTCGAQSQKWLGRCPDCGAWNSFVEEKVGPAVPEPRGAVAALGGQGAQLYK